MPKGSTFKNDVLKLFLENSSILTIGDAGGLLQSVAPGSVYIALHSADPVAGDQTTSEATYTGYARKAVVRADAQWTTNSGATENTQAITFDPCTGGSTTVTHFSVGAEASGASLILYSGTCSLTVTNGITPEFAAGALDITEA